ncbi:Uncharacterised protein [Mycobacteroides abscessus subsp. abscessus]|nr:Uncharacterised protein [Mycobacteroides abscessus subsp. abscessus]SKV19409.1 Uncharacterised protein [Mycobacteroides abscessus subsp. abscessus]
MRYAHARRTATLSPNSHGPQARTRRHADAPRVGIGGSTFALVGSVFSVAIGSFDNLAHSFW